MRWWVVTAALAIAAVLLFRTTSGPPAAGVDPREGARADAEASTGPTLEPGRAPSEPARASRTGPRTGADGSPRGAVGTEEIEEVQEDVAEVRAEEAGGTAHGEARLARNDERRVREPAWRRPGPEAKPTVKRLDAVGHALRWLAAHQALDGRFPAQDFGRWCEGRNDVVDPPAGAGSPDHDVGATALALCSFLGCGYTNRGEPEFSEVVARGLRWLCDLQDLSTRQHNEFWIRTSDRGAWAWDHACATLALVHGYGLTGSPTLGDAAARALSALARLGSRSRAQEFRYSLREDDGDFSLTLWALLPHVAARHVDDERIRRGESGLLPVVLDWTVGGRPWLDQHLAARPGRAGDSTTLAPAPPLPADSPDAMRAFAVALRLFYGDSPKDDPALADAVAAVAASAPPRDAPPETEDMFLRWAGTLATFQAGGKAWASWEESLAGLVGRQHVDGDYCGLKGSWDPAGAWATEGGRVVTTAVNAMSLTVVCRYDKAIGVR